jgi:hypothetical protein
MKPFAYALGVVLAASLVVLLDRAVKVYELDVAQRAKAFKMADKATAALDSLTGDWSLEDLELGGSEL